MAPMNSDQQLVYNQVESAINAAQNAKTAVANAKAAISAAPGFSAPNAQSDLQALADAITEPLATLQGYAQGISEGGNIT
jgi:hypothetical protein